MDNIVLGSLLSPFPGFDIHLGTPLCNLMSYSRSESSLIELREGFEADERRERRDICLVFFCILGTYV